MFIKMFDFSVKNFDVWYFNIYLKYCLNYSNVFPLSETNVIEKYTCKKHFKF